jgi:asparagine synthase (glutamine-hydrolysing)
MAQSVGAEQEMLRLTSADLYGRSFETTTKHAERTFYNTLAVAKWHMSKRVRECGFKVVITGEGSDELFGGYPFFKRDLILHATDHGGEELQKQLDKSNAVFRGAILAEVQQSHEAWNDICGFTPSWIQPWMLTLEACRPLLSDDTLQRLSEYDPIEAIAAKIDPAKVKGRHPLDIAQYTWSKTMLEGQILTWGGDRVDMANSMESRPAFLDHHLAEFATRIPPSLRIKNGIEKWVLREAAKGVLPEELYKREKFAFMAPPSHTDKAKASAMDELAAQWLSTEAIEGAGLFDEERVRDFLATAHDSDDPIAARRSDILVNHLVQLHILDQSFRAEPAHVA